MVVRPLRSPRSTQPDVVLMDIRMPVMDGLEATRIIASDRHLEDVRVLVLTTFEIDEYVFEALRVGASGFLLKDVEPDDLRSAIRLVAAGHSLLAPAITRRVIEQFSRANRGGRTTRRAHGSRARGYGARGGRALERRNCNEADDEPAHCQDPRQSSDDEARSS